MKELITKTAEVLNGLGFVTEIGDDYVDVVLSKEDTQKILNAYSNSGLKGSDSLCKEAGFKLETLLLANNGDRSNYVFYTDGYNVDDKEKTIALRLKPVLAKAWEKLPKGWTEKSARKFWNSLTGDKKHKITQCMEKMKDKVTNPGAFCASLARKMKYKPEEGLGQHKKKKKSTVIRIFESLRDKYKRILYENVPVETAMEHVAQLLDDCPDIKKFARRLARVSTLNNKTKRSFRRYVDRAIDYLETEVPIEKANRIMRNAIKQLVSGVTENSQKETPRVVRDLSGDVISSLKRRIDAVSKRAGKFDPVTDVYTGKDEGPEPVQAQEKYKKPPKKDAELAQEKTKVTTKKLEIAQDEKLKMGNRHIEAMELVEKAIELGMLKEEDRRKQFKEFLKMSNIKFQEFKKVLDSVEDPDKVVIIDGKIADLQELVDE